MVVELPIRVTLASLSMEVPPPGLVGVMECGVAVNQLVKVTEFCNSFSQFVVFLTYVGIRVKIVYILNV